MTLPGHKPHLSLVMLLVVQLLGVVTSPVGAAEIAVDPNHTKAVDTNAGSTTAPLKTLARALAVAKAGDTILLGTGQYPAVSIASKYAKVLTLRAAKGAKPVLVDGILFKGAERVRVEGIKFTWADGAKPKSMKPFIEIDGSQHIEVAGCNITDSAKKTEWLGMAVDIQASKHITVRDCGIHNTYFGIAVTASEHVTLQNLDIGPWSHEDGIRVTECLGPVLIDGCHLTNTGIAGRKGGHVDAIQVVFWSDNLTIRNCHIHGVAQAIGAFHCVDKRASIPNRRRRNWRIEGNLIYDVYTPHACTICETDGVVVVNNTFPQGHANLYQCTDGVVKNNIFGSGNLRPECIKEADYNLWITGGKKTGAHDLLGTAPLFVNAPTGFFKTDHRYRKDCTRKKLFASSLKGRVKVGEKVEVLVTDGSGRDGTLREVVAVGDAWIEVNPPLASDPEPLFGVLIYAWPDGHMNLKPDYRLRGDSPAIDSADGDIDRAKDAEGHSATDVLSVKNTGGGKMPYRDRGAFEYVPGK